MADEQTAVETISARAAARMFHTTVEDFYEFSIQSAIYIREVPDRPSLEYREWRMAQPAGCIAHKEMEPWHYIPPAKIIYRLEDVIATYEAIYEEKPRLPKPRKQAKVDRVTQTIEQLIAAGKLSETWTQRPSASEWAALRTFVLERDNYTCQYCSRTTGTMHVDHITPVGRGGNHPDNLVAACESCNLRKHSRTPEEWLS